VTSRYAHGKCIWCCALVECIHIRGTQVCILIHRIHIYLHTCVYTCTYSPFTFTHFTHLTHHLPFQPPLSPSSHPQPTSHIHEKTPSTSALAPHSKPHPLLHTSRFAGRIGPFMSPAHFHARWCGDLYSLPHGGRESECVCVSMYMRG
jgi:hypothetical protein